MPEAKSHGGKFPRIYRFITESPKEKKIFYGKILLFSLITTFLLVSIFLQGYQLFEGVRVLHAASTQRETLESQRAYWGDVVKRHPGYRDAYFKLAVLSYQLGEKTKARDYIETTLLIDPNFMEAQDFVRQMGL